MKKGLLSLWLFTSALLASLVAATQPQNAPVIPLDELRAGMKGEVWTVFSGTQPEPFSVEVTGVVKNALGPGKSIILCQLTDPRVQNMGAVAGMSGSPLYIEGRLAGALSYQLQRFETVRYAGFTPVADLLEVSALQGTTPPPAPAAPGFFPLESTHSDSDRPRDDASAPASQTASTASLDPFRPLAPVFSLGGISPQVLSVFAPRLEAMGLQVTALGGSSSGPADFDLHSSLNPGDAVAAALCVGDITVAGTGTVSRVEGNQVLAFGHPLMSLGSVDLPMVSAEIVTILPSSMNSFKIANTGQVIGSIRQDRLSAICGELGEAPKLLPVTVNTPGHTLHFSVIRHATVTPSIIAMGVTQAVTASNESGLSQGFRIESHARFANGRTLDDHSLYAGAQAFNASLGAFIGELTTWLQNPVEEIFPAELSFDVQALPENPSAVLDNLQLSRTAVRVGDTLTATLTVRDYQGEPRRLQVDIPVPAAWQGRNLDVVVAPGPVLDRLTGTPAGYRASEIRTIDAYLDAVGSARRGDGLYLAVVERSDGFFDQTHATVDFPGSLDRIARTADRERFQTRPIATPLWEQHVLDDRLVQAASRQPLQVLD